jgi:cellulose synthase/poly-beta-1,6-N-acetylglucosamine synthase-like glycosyltransferase
MWLNLLNNINIILLGIISIFGFNALIITCLYLLKFNQKNSPQNFTGPWPVVAVQIPIYNEEMVVERIIEQIIRFDYPKDQLVIQVLDDSTDQTTDIAFQVVEKYQSLGYQIDVIHRDTRSGYKAGALANGLTKTTAEFFAVFDADFLPPPDYLKKVIPFFYSNPQAGMVQARWGHVNRESNLLTRTQALFLDGHQIVEQVARSRSGLLCNFNGSGGTWRAACIADAGGWQADTLSEDIDLSFRAQMHGWKLYFLPDLVIPAEIPPNLGAFKQQQYRWNFGYAQVLKKLLLNLWSTKNLSFQQRIFGTFHLSANVTQLAGLFIFLVSVPMAWFHPKQSTALGLLSVATSGPSILFAVSQLFGYHDHLFRRFLRLIYLPLLVMLTIGTSISNSKAVLSALSGKKIEFFRTPKYSLVGKDKNQQNKAGSGPVVLITLEILASIYMAFGLSIAMQRSPELIPVTALGMLSFGFVGFTGLVESFESQPEGKVKKTSQIEIYRH